MSINPLRLSLCFLTFFVSIWKVFLSYVHRFSSLLSSFQLFSALRSWSKPFFSCSSQFISVSRCFPQFFSMFSNVYLFFNFSRFFSAILNEFVFGFPQLFLNWSQLFSVLVKQKQNPWKLPGIFETCATSLQYCTGDLTKLYPHM